MDTSGFYLLETDGTASGLLHAPNFVDAPDYSISREHREEYEYPVHGWRWFDSREDALAFHGITDPPPPSEEPTYTDMTVHYEPPQVQG